MADAPPSPLSDELGGVQAKSRGSTRPLSQKARMVDALGRFRRLAAVVSQVLRWINDRTLAHSLPGLRTDDPVNVEPVRLLEVAYERIGLRTEVAVMIDETPLALDCEHRFTGVSLLDRHDQPRPRFVRNDPIGLESVALLEGPYRTRRRRAEDVVGRQFRPMVSEEALHLEHAVRFLGIAITLAYRWPRSHESSVRSADQVRIP